MSAEGKAVPGLKCHKCDRPVRPTLHWIDKVEVDYYVINQTIGKPPVVECVGCYSPPRKEVS